MTRLEKCELAIEKGCKYDSKTGKIYGVKGSEIKCIGKQGYINMTLCANSKRYDLRAHHFAFYSVYGEIPQDIEIDHINGIRHDNRIINLRKVTTQENAFNRTKAMGYSWCKLTNKWNAQIKMNGKSINLGYFENENDAKKAYLDSKKILHKINDN